MQSLCLLVVTHVLCYVDDGVQDLRCVGRVQGALGRTGGGDGQVTVETYLPVVLPSAHCVHVCVKYLKQYTWSCIPLFEPSKLRNT